jgi:dihydroorotase
MSALSRRHFLALTGSAAAAAMSGRPVTSAEAAMGPADKFDLVIKGGDVLDPSQSLRGKRDIGIRWGVIEAIEAEIAPARALKTIDATDKLVTPGLIDLHCHVYPYGSAIGIPADELVQFQGSMRSSTSPTTACRLSRSRSSTTSTTRKWRPAPWRSPKIRIS